MAVKSPNMAGAGWIRQLHAEVAEMFRNQASGSVMVRHMCQGVDVFLRDLWRACAGPESEDVDLLAIGGYGRGELCPYSDWDLWFLVPEHASTGIEKDIQRFMYALWDMRAHVGHAVRTVNETLDHIRTDWDAATAAIEARLLCGKGAAFSLFRSKLRKVSRRDRRRFIKVKLEEFERRRRLKGDTAFLMEPDIKAGKGGLRDIQAVFWMGLAWYEAPTIHSLVALNIFSGREYQQLMRARDFLWRCRVGLHLESGTGNERLTFELQSHLARMMGYKDRMHRPAVEWFMRRYFSHARHVADLADMFVMHFKEQIKPRRLVRRKDLGDGFYLEGKWVGVKNDSVFAEEPLRLLKIFHVAQHDHRRLESDALRTIRANTHYITSAFNRLPEANQLFLSILREKRNIAWALKEMNSTGVLGRFIPDFGRIVAQGQFDRYHAYTVDEHSIRAVAESRNFHLGRADRERFPLACELMPRIRSPWLLYLALLFHDLAKGRRGDHSINGERLVRRFCQRLGLNKDDTGLVAWLVRHHLAMAYTSQRSDLGDQTVIEKFAHLVGDMERLQYLYLLTVADICAVGPHVWNDWKGALLRELYHATEQVLVTGPVSGEDMRARLKARIESALNAALVSERSGLSPVLKSLPARALLHFPAMQLLAVGRLMVDCRESTGVAFYVDRIRGETEVLILAEDHAGLFANLTTAISRGHVNIIAAKAFDLGGGRILDVFHVQDASGKPLSEISDQERLKRRIEAVLRGEPVEFRPPEIKPHVLIKHVRVLVRELPTASSRQTAVEVVAADRPGLLAQLALTIAELSINIRGATISTFGEKVADVFFLTDTEGRPLSRETTRNLCDRLKEVAVLPEDK